MKLFFYYVRTCLKRLVRAKSFYLIVETKIVINEWKNENQFLSMSSNVFCSIGLEWKARQREIVQAHLQKWNLCLSKSTVCCAMENSKESCAVCCVPMTCCNLVQKYSFKQTGSASQLILAIWYLKYWSCLLSDFVSLNDYYLCYLVAGKVCLRQMLFFVHWLNVIGRDVGFLSSAWKKHISSFFCIHWYLVQQRHVVLMKVD